MRNLKSGLLFTSAAVAVAFAASTTMATAQIETITVTASKRAENIQDVSMSIDVKTGAELEALQIRDFKALQNYVPNLLIQPSPGNDAIFIRGFGSQAANYAFDQSVSLYIDGIYGGRNRQFMAPFFDVERIEIMRGPQGALLGKNTAAGALSIITASPTDTFEGGVTGSYNFSRSGYDVRGYVSGPISDELSGRLAVQHVDMDGWVHNRFNGKDEPGIENTMARGSLRYAPGDDFEMTAKLEIGDFFTGGTAQVRVGPAGAPLNNVKNASPPLGTPETDDVQTVNGSLTTNIGIGDHTLTLITGYSQFDADKFVGGGATVPENWLSVFRETFDQFSQEVRLLSPTGQTIEYIVGAYYDVGNYEQVNISSYENFLGLGFFDGQIHHVFEQEATTWSVFAAATWHAMEDLRLKGSIRYTVNEKDGAISQFTDFGIPLTPPFSLSGSISEESVDPSVTVEYDIDDDIMIYASMGKGSKAGGFVATRNAKPTDFIFDAERSTNYEIGVKSVLLDGRVVFNVSAFRMPFKDLQVSSRDPILNAFVTNNAASATSEGVEANIVWQAFEKLKLDASVAYLDASYDDFPGAGCLTVSPPGCTPATNNLAGFTLFGASKWTGNVRATLVEHLANGLDIEAMGLAYFRSEFTTATDASPVYGVQDGYVKYDARLQLSDPDSNWALAVIGKNLTDEKTHNFAYLWPISLPATGINFIDETFSLAVEGSVRF